MIFRHYTIKCPNNINDIINELEKINTGYTDLYVNASHVNKDNNIILEIDEKQSGELLSLY